MRTRVLAAAASLLAASSARAGLFLGAGAPVWTEAASSATGHSGAQRALLLDGRVFVTTGGTARVFEGQTIKSEIFDPSSGTWSRAADFPGTGREFFGITVLQDGRVLLSGGLSQVRPGSIDYFNDSWLYDPAGDSWSPCGSLPFYGTANLTAVLDDGRVLAAFTLQSDVAGGHSLPFTASRAAAIFDPVTRAWNEAGSMRDQHGLGAMLKLADGRVAVIGGRRVLPAPADELSNSIEIYDPSADSWSRTEMPAAPEDPDDTFAPGSINDPSAVLLHSGNVLIVGGGYGRSDGNIIPRRRSLIFQPESNSFASNRGPQGTAVSVPMMVARAETAPVTLADGRVLIVSGVNSSFLTTTSCEIYDPVSDRFAFTTSLPTKSTDPRTGTDQPGFAAFLGTFFESALLLEDGRVFFYPAWQDDAASSANKRTFLFAP